MLREDNREEEKASSSAPLRGSLPGQPILRLSVYHNSPALDSRAETVLSGLPRQVSWYDSHGRQLEIVREFVPSEKGDDSEEEWEDQKKAGCCVVQ